MLTSVSPHLIWSEAISWCILGDALWPSSCIALISSPDLPSARSSLAHWPFCDSQISHALGCFHGHCTEHSCLSPRAFIYCPSLLLVSCSHVPLLKKYLMRSIDLESLESLQAHPSCPPSFLWMPFIHTYHIAYCLSSPLLPQQRSYAVCCCASSVLVQCQWWRKDWMFSH